MAAAGFDWLVLDMEHSVLELSEVQSIIQVLDGKLPGHCKKLEYSWRLAIHA